MAEAAPDSEATRRLLESLENGESAAFDELFARHRSFLRRVVDVRLDGKLRSRVDPSDIVQETHLEAYRRLRDYLARRPMPFRLWLRKTACERVMMTHRKHVQASRRSVDRELSLTNRSSDQLAQQLLASEISPSQQMGKSELARRVRQSVLQLPELDREILLMRHFEGLSHREAAQVLNVEEAAARKRYGRALLRLSRLLADGGLTESQIR
ncbi:MAG: sigma-70 family RNA polymerase sigma factor [Planctomycetales bacterium]